MKVIILGTKGMLGQMAHAYFSRSYETIAVNTRYSLERNVELLSALENAGEGYVINCIGKIKQKSEDASELFTINAVLPLHLYNNLQENQFLIQPSTDCVFSGEKSNWYHVHDKCDATDSYGISKRLGEVALLQKSNAYIVRVSIIGTDHIAQIPSGLLGWFLNCPPQAQLQGFTNHYWNGITTLEWCKSVERIVLADTARQRTGQIIQLGTSESRSKHELLCLFQEKFKTDFSILPHQTPVQVNRCLEPLHTSPNLERQLDELKRFTIT